jgi:hypothetical protein
MNLSEVKKVKVGSKEIPVKITIRGMIEYNKMSNESVPTFDSTEKIIQFFYCTAKAGAKAEGTPFDYTFDGFLDLIDDYYLEAVTNFSQAIFEPGGDGKKRK